MQCDEKEVEYAIQLMKYAKQDVNEVALVTQKLFCPSEKEYCNAKENIKILQFDEDYIQRLEAGDSLYFKGSENETLVFCTEEKTYEVKDVEVSNSLLLCPKLLYGDDIKLIDVSSRIVKKESITGIFHNFLERRLTFPRLRKLRCILTPTAYAGPEQEVYAEHCGYYLTELLDIIQCSREELLSGLKEISACCIDGRWRLLSLKYESAILSLIIGLMEENSCNFIIKAEAKRALKSRVPDFIIDHVFLHFGTPTGDVLPKMFLMVGVHHKTDDDRFALKEDKVCRCFAEALLTAAGGTFLLDEFMKTWKASLPSGMEADLRHLRGLALTEKGKGDEDVICLFQECLLPENIPERFRLLFKRKEIWLYDEIAPYIEKVSTKLVGINTLLTKYATFSVENGERVYTARHIS